MRAARVEYKKHQLDPSNKTKLETFQRTCFETEGTFLRSLTLDLLRSWFDINFKD